MNVNKVALELEVKSNASKLSSLLSKLQERILNYQEIRHHLYKMLEGLMAGVRLETNL